MHYLGVPKIQETGQEIEFPCSRERRKEIIKQQFCKKTKISKQRLNYEKLVRNIVYSIQSNKSYLLYCSCLAIGCCQIASGYLAIKECQIASKYTAIHDCRIAIAHLAMITTNCQRVFSNTRSPNCHHSFQQQIMPNHQQLFSNKRTPWDQQSFSNAGDVMLTSSSQTRGYMLRTVLHLLKTY